MSIGGVPVWPKGGAGVWGQVTPGLWLGLAGVGWCRGIAQGDADTGLAQEWPREPDASAKVGLGVPYSRNGMNIARAAPT